MQLPLIILLQIVLPAFLLGWLWLPRPPDRFSWLMRVLYGASYLAFIVVVGRWDFLSSHLRSILPLVYAASAALSFQRVRPLAWNKSTSPLRTHALSAVLVVYFLVLAVRGLVGYGYPQNAAVELAFPLGEGTYHVGQGGSTSLINHHYVDASQRYAIDIVALNSPGVRAAGLMPSGLNNYLIYGRDVKAPCAGEIVALRDGIDDNHISETNTDEPAGNHVVLACDGTNILLAHLQKGTMSVEKGETVDTGDLIGFVGNSGNSSEPHLHIHAYIGDADYADGRGVPMTFDDRFLVRGSTIAIPP